MAFKRNRGDKEEVPGAIEDGDVLFLKAAGIDVKAIKAAWKGSANKLPEAKAAMADRLMGEMGIVNKMKARARIAVEKVM